MARILLADDHVVIRRGLSGLLLTRPDFSICAEASDGREAVEYAVKHKPDVAVLDISLPILNGIDATRQIRRDAPDTEILIFSMHDSEDLIREVLRAGARGYLLKSDADEHIVNAVETLMRHRPYLSKQISEMLFDTFVDNREVGAVSATLTAREREVVQLVAEGNSNKAIARQLEISVKTVETHRSAAMRKVRVRSTAELVRYAVRNKLIQA